MQSTISPNKLPLNESNEKNEKDSNDTTSLMCMSSTTSPNKLSPKKNNEENINDSSDATSQMCRLSTSLNESMEKIGNNSNEPSIPTKPSIESSVLELNEAKKEDECIDKNLLDFLESMGLDSDLSKEALRATKSISLEAALDYIAEAEVSSSDGDSGDFDEEEFYKMVFVVNTELKMSAGKVASQVAHAALGLYRTLKEDGCSKYKDCVEEWEETGETIVTLKGKSSEDLKQFQAAAKEKELPTYLVQDAGRTQIKPGSFTILGIFGNEEIVNEITGQLSLI